MAYNSNDCDGETLGLVPGTAQAGDARPETMHAAATKL
jgi:hypothetical protein